MSRNLIAIARQACHRGDWLFAACEAHSENRPVEWFTERERALRIAARRADLPAA